jgi:hypothetical protein
LQRFHFLYDKFKHIEIVGTEKERWKNRGGVGYWRRGETERQIEVVA